MGCNVNIFYNYFSYSSNHNKIDIKQHFVDFFEIFFIESKNEEKDVIIRFFLPLIKLYIDYYKAFDSPLSELWLYIIKPYIFEKYPQTSTEVFTENSDIHFLMNLVEDSINKFETKDPNNQKMNVGDKPQMNEQASKPEFKNSENKNIQKTNKKVNSKREEDIKIQRNKNIENINSFLVDFIKNNDIEKKRGNSMMSLRHSKTLASLSTCDDSVCFEEKIENKSKKKSNMLIIDNSEIHRQKTKDMIQKSRQLYQDILSKPKEETKENKQKFGKLVGLQKTTTSNMLLKMYPQYKEIEKENEKNDIEYKKGNIAKISADLLLKKIIFKNFIDNNLLLIKHFCQQCFCFLNIEIFFKKIFHCYKVYKAKDISFEKLKNLIEFINILTIELFEYHEKMNYNDMKIPLLKKFYNELISDFIFDCKKENDILVEDKDKNNNNIININKSNNFEFNKDNAFIDSIIDRKNLINLDLNFDEKNIKLFLIEEKKQPEGKNDKKKSLNIQFNKVYKILKTFKRPSIINKTNKITDKIEGEIKEENREDDSDSDSNSSFSETKKEKNEIVNNTDNWIDEFIDEDRTNDLISSIVNKTLKDENNIISIKEEIMCNINYIFKLLNLQNGESIPLSYILKAKSSMSFYSEIKATKREKARAYSKVSFSASRKMLLSSPFSFKSSSNSGLKTLIPLKNYFCITDYNTEDIGDKLTEVTKSLLNKIHPRELYRGIYLKEKKNITSPNVINCINNFNKLTSFIIEDIVSYDTSKLRAKVFEKWVQICDYCRINKNYNDCLAIYSALNNFIITGLKLTAKEIKSKIKSMFEQLSKFCSCEANYKNIRNDMTLCALNNVNFIPYLGMLLRDINFVEESSKYIDEKGLINIEKIEKINDLFEKYFKYKKNENKKNIRELPSNLNFFENLEEIKEEELENIANNIEPEFKYKNQEVKRLTNIDKKYFQRKHKKRGTVNASNLRSTMFSFSNFFNS